MFTQASDLARRLAERAEMVCRHYLSNGRRSGNYWLVGDINNTPGRSLFVRLTGPQSGKRVAGKWTDGATGQHGDLLDVIQLSRGLAFSDAADEAHRFLSMPPPAPGPANVVRRRPAAVGSPEAARRLWAISQGIAGTLAQSSRVDPRRQPRWGELERYRLDVDHDRGAWGAPCGIAHGAKILTFLQGLW